MKKKRTKFDNSTNNSDLMKLTYNNTTKQSINNKKSSRYKKFYITKVEETLVAKPAETTLDLFFVTIQSVR